jgi:hypothetical protein
MWLTVLLTLLAVARATRLLTVDTFPPIASVKGRLVRANAPDWLIYMFGTGKKDEPGCPWCVSVWLAAPVVWLVDVHVAGGLVAPVLVWAASSVAAGYMVGLEPE